MLAVTCAIPPRGAAYSTHAGKVGICFPDPCEGGWSDLSYVHGSSRK